MAHPYPLGQIDDLVVLLSAHLPSALPVLGSLSAVGEVTEIYTSFSPQQTIQIAKQQADGGRPFFIVLTHMTGGKDSSDQGRIYCSSEQAEGEGSPMDTQLVYAFVRSYMAHLPSGTSRFVGSIHARWANVLRTNTSYVSGGPLAQWIADPASTPNQMSPLAVPDGYYIDRLVPNDITHVVQTSKQSRTNAYIQSRLPHSVCVRAVGTDTLVAWGLLHSDCSVGTIFVEPDHRGRRIARAVVERLPLHCGRDTTGGWRFTHVASGNEQGSGLFGALPGWTYGWDTFWMRFVPGEEWKS